MPRLSGVSPVQHPVSGSLCGDLGAYHYFSKMHNEKNPNQIPVVRQMMPSFSQIEEQFGKLHHRVVENQVKKLKAEKAQLKRQLSAQIRKNDKRILELEEKLAEVMKNKEGRAFGDGK